jgi:putative nucleotidyltransferase with HDIG domain
LLVSEHPHGLEVALRTQTLGVTLPEVAALDGVQQPSFHDLDVLAHTFQTVGNVSPTAVMRWAALLHDVGKGPTRSVEPDGRIRFFGHAKVGAELAERICRRMRMSTDTFAIVHLVPNTAPRRARPRQSEAVDGRFASSTWGARWQEEAGGSSLRQVLDL